MATSSRSGSTIRSSRAAELWTLAAIVAAAAALRLHGLASVFPVDDEYFQLYSSLKPASLGALFALMRENPHHALLDPLSNWLLARVWKDTAVLRLPAALWGAALPLAVWSLARKALDAKTSLLAAFLAAVSLLHVDWSRRDNFYALLPVLPALQAAAWLDVEKDPRRWKPFAAWSAVFALAHPYGSVLPLVYGIISYKRPAVAGAWVKASIAAGLAFLPWFAFSTSALLDHRLFDFRGVPAQLTLPQFVARAPLFLAQAPEAGLGKTWGLGVGSVLALLYLACFVYSARRRDKPPLLLACAAAVPLGLAVVAALDLRYRYYFAGRQLLVVLPFYLVAVADGVSRVLTRLRVPVYAAALALAAVWAPLYGEMTSAQQELQTGFTRMTEQIAAAVRPGDSFAFAHDELAMGFLYHYDRAAFLRVEGYHLDRGGHLSYVLPPSLTARRGTVDVPVRVSPRRPDGLPEPTAWTFHGTMYDLYVEPPLRAAGGAIRTGG